MCSRPRAGGTARVARRSALAWLAAIALLAHVAPRSAAADAPNLLRNGDFQDDWITLLPENLTLHWSYSPVFANRRDFNPDGWSLKGSWRWLDAGAAAGHRRLVIEGPQAEVRQRVNWVAINDDRQLEGFPDAGGFPSFAAVRSSRPLALVRDLVLRVRVKGTDVPPGAATIEIGLAPAGKVASGDPLGTVVPPTATASVALPEGSFDWRSVEVRLAASDWVRSAGAADAEAAKSGPVLPGTASVALRYRGASGRVEVDRAELVSAEPSSPNLLPHGSFEEIDGSGWAAGWKPAEKYTYFPPGLYYLFNSWHNEGFSNRGAPGIDSLVVRSGRRSLRMPALAGDELAVSSAPVVLNQKEARLIEASVWVKTDRVNEIQIDARNEKGERLDGFDFISKSPTSIGTNEWRLLRQVFRPREPVAELTLVLAARGVNGYTLGSTSEEPQNNVAGTVWWDDARLYEPESSAAELSARGVKPPSDDRPPATLHLADLDVGERLLGENLLRATVVNPGEARKLALEWQLTSPAGRVTKFQSAPVDVPARGETSVEVPYVVSAAAAPPYRESRGVLGLLGENGDGVGSTEIALSQWTRPIDLRLGALYLRPEQKELVRMNLGLSHATLAKLRRVRLEIVRRGTGETVATQEIPATPAALEAQLERVPAGLRGDFANLLLAELDVSRLPIEPFVGPERRWFVRATAIGLDGRAVATVDSAPFCRQAHDEAQEPVRTVEVRRNLLYVNRRPWIPWGAIYGFAPAYDGPADAGPGGYRDFHNLPEWSIYDGFTSKPYNRRDNDFDALRYVPATVADAKSREEIERHWKDDGLYAATYFVAPGPVFSWDDLAAKSGSADRLQEVLRFAADAPMIVSTSPGFEESFGAFHAATPEQLRSLAELVRSLRAKTGKPVMVGHGGAWSRFEFEKVPFFDIFDPETEPLFPANLHTDLWPLVAGRDQVIWLRPQLYESVPYERWRFHTYVELMRGARGWQMAHGPADATTFRGLHGELASLTPAMYSSDPGPDVAIEPEIEHWSRRAGGKTYVIAATTHALAFGRWRWSDDARSPAGRARVSEPSLPLPRSDNELDRIAERMQPDWIVHGIDSFPDARPWKPGTKLVQWVRIDPSDPTRGLALVARTDGRWSAMASWGDAEVEVIPKELPLVYWFLRRFYRNAVGFIGYRGEGAAQSFAHAPDTVHAEGALPPAGTWVKLEAPLADLGAVGKMLDGVGLLQRSGRVFWGRTSLVTPDGSETALWGDALGRPPAERARTRVRVAGLRQGALVRVLFEDRQIRAEEGYFEDDFRGQDLYQRYGGPDGYGDAPVALHIYEVP